VDHLLDHVYAMAVAPMDEQQRESFETWLWSNPAKEAKILTDLARP
jgi:hypothetical protein